MKLNYYLVFLLCIALFSVSCKTLKSTHGQIASEHNVLDIKDAVPNSETAKKIAFAVLVPIYGNSIYKQSPLQCNLVKDSIWVVTGSMPKSKPGGPVFSGGVAYIEIQKKDCKVLRITHGK